VARHLATYITHPAFEVSDEGSDLVPAHSAPLFMRQTIDRALKIKDRVDASHCLDRERCFRELSQLEEVAPAM
jgi:hypothetical protein